MIVENKNTNCLCGSDLTGRGIRLDGLGMLWIPSYMAYDGFWNMFRLQLFSCNVEPRFHAVKHEYLLKADLEYTCYNL